MEKYPFTMTQTAVLEAVMKHCPVIHPHLEIEREWIWYTGPSLQGEANKPTREAMKLIGFRYKNGVHEMPSGKSGSWSHHCLRPIPRKGSKSSGQPLDRADTPRDVEAGKLAAQLADAFA